MIYEKLFKSKRQPDVQVQIKSFGDYPGNDKKTENKKKTQWTVTNLLTRNFG